MLNKKVITWVVTFLWCCLTLSSGNAASTDGLGQTIQIQTHLGYLRGRGTLLIVVRDIDHQQNIPYFFDITRPNNVWLIYTHSRHYLITASRLQWIRYKPCCNQFKSARTDNFCHLESNGRILRGRSMKVLITGDLSPHPYTYSCQVDIFPEGDFTIVSQKVCNPVLSSNLGSCPCPNDIAKDGSRCGGRSAWCRERGNNTFCFGTNNPDQALKNQYCSS